MKEQDRAQVSQLHAELILLDDEEAQRALNRKIDLYSQLSQGPVFAKKDSLKYDYGVDNSKFDPSPFKIDIAEIAEIGEVESVSKSEKTTKCNCSRTKCQKNYCECFRSGNVCGSVCSCVGCCNNQPQTFMFKRVNSGTGCKCQRRNCLLNYCECHSSGRKCSEQCKCLNCLNVEDRKQQGKRRIRKTKKVKKQNQNKQ